VSSEEMAPPVLPAGGVAANAIEEKANNAAAEAMVEPILTVFIGIFLHIGSCRAGIRRYEGSA